MISAWPFQSPKICMLQKWFMCRFLCFQRKGIQNTKNFFSRVDAWPSNLRSFDFCLIFPISKNMYATEMIYVSFLMFQYKGIQSTKNFFSTVDAWPSHWKSFAFCVTFLISGNMHAAEMIYVSFLMFSMSRNSTKKIYFCRINRLTFKIKAI